MENLYEILEVSKNASPEVIEKAYKTLVKKYHPDVAKDKQQAEKMMKKLNSAYEILSNPDSKAEYDFNLQQEDNRLSTNQNAMSNEDANKEYNQYYNVENQAESDNNIYNNRYDYESDYANNTDFIKRIFRLNLDKDTKIILLIIFVLIVSLIINAFTNIFYLFRNNSNMNDSNISASTIKEDDNERKDVEYEIDDITPINILNRFIKNMKEYDFKEINTYLTESSKLSEKNINSLYNDKDIYQYIISNSEYSIKEYHVTNKKATIIVIINRFDVEKAIEDYYIDKMNSFEIGTNEQEVRKIVALLEKNVDKKVSKEITIIVNKTDNDWKINLTYNNISQILGTRIL